MTDSITRRYFGFWLDVEDGVHSEYDPEVVTETLGRAFNRSVPTIIASDPLLTAARGDISKVEQMYPGDVVGNEDGDLPDRTMYLSWNEDRERMPGELFTGFLRATREEAEADVMEIAYRIYDDNPGACEDPRPTNYADCVGMLNHWYYTGAGVTEVVVPRI